MPRFSSSAVASGAEALAAERERFLREGTLTDVFAVAYFHVTQRIVQQAQQFQHPAVVQAQLIGFYAAYENRASLAHWQPYLALAGARTLKRGTDPGALLAVLLERALTAHITYDLPPALVATRPQELAWESLAPDFFALDPFFDKALHAAFDDFGRVTGKRLGSLRTTHREALELGNWLRCRFGGGTVRLRHLRREAWQKAHSVTFSPEMPYNSSR
jgi:Family of unknown function (DUF5995)